MITEDYVSFETAMLLKEKGFDAEIKTYWEKALYEPYLEFVPEPRNHEVSNSEGYLTFRGNKDTIEDEDILCIAPTVQMAMKWLREAHKLWIEFSVFCPAPEEISKQEDCVPRYFYRIKKYNIGYMDFITSEEHTLNFPSYEEACEAAIKYCLENLI